MRMRIPIIIRRGLWQTSFVTSGHYCAQSSLPSPFDYACPKDGGLESRIGPMQALFVAWTGGLGLRLGLGAGAAGSRANGEWGFIPTSTSVVKVATVSVGFIRGDIESALPREYAFMQLDQGIIDIAAVCIKKDWTVSFGMDEALQVNLQNSWDNDAPG